MMPFSHLHFLKNFGFIPRVARNEIGDRGF